MPDPDPQQTGNNPDPKEGEGSGDDPTKEFWAEFDKRVDAGIERAVGKWRKSAPVGTSRSGRSSLPTILADLVFGPSKSGD